MKKRIWSDAEIAMLRGQFAHTRTDDIAAALGRGYGQVAQKASALGLKKSAAYIAGPDAHRFDGKKGEGSRFTPGQAAWNKGIRGVVGVQPECRATQFKPGRPAHEARNYLPIGSLRICADGYLERKVTDDPSLPPARRWVAVHRQVWEAAHGQIPAGCVVVFKAGRKTTVEADVTADALECITRHDLMRRNSVHTIYPPELARIVQLRGALNRQINRRAKEIQT